MTDENLRQRLLSYLRADDGDLWSIVGELDSTPEPDLRQILRPHLEAGFEWVRDETTIKQRDRLDHALGAVTLFEIGRQLGIVAETDQLPAQVSLANLCANSEAFLHYTNVYLYFGVRFHAGRIAPPDWLTQGVHPGPGARDSNARTCALVTPPAIPLGARGTAPHKLASFLEVRDADRLAPISYALRFLDDYVANDDEKPDLFEGWLRGLRPETRTETTGAFSRLAAGLVAWATTRSAFYLSLQSPPPQVPSGADAEPARVEERASRPAGGWLVTDPITPRLGLADFYWIAKILRADVTADAVVTYQPTSWLNLLGFQAALRGDVSLQESLRNAEEVLRSVFDFTCDLIQNAIELTSERESQAFEPELFSSEIPEETVQWRKAFDEELVEIKSQREQRRYRDLSLPDLGRNAPPPEDEQFPGWSRRIKTGEQPANLIGLAFSGGGIRSATFNLGVLQGLQEFDLLRFVDYLSTVSGGGFIGSWLVANVDRFAHWLGRLTNWEESVSHLRRYSNYLAPSSGLLSADTWTMWAIYLRNAFLIQVTAIMWLTVLLVTALAGKPLFYFAGKSPLIFWGTIPGSGLLAAVMAALVVITLLYNLAGGSGPKREAEFKAGLRDKFLILPAWIRSRFISVLWWGELGRQSAGSAQWVRRLAVLPSWISSFILAGLFWADATGNSGLHGKIHFGTYSSILLSAWTAWGVLLGFVWFALLLIAGWTLTRHRWHAWWISLLSTAVLYLEFCAIEWLFFKWKVYPEHFGWYAYVLGPSLVLAATTLSVVLFIGFCGRNSGEWIREWWTRFGTWLGIYGVGYLAVTTAAVFGPMWVLSLFGTHWSVKGGTLAGLIGTVISGLFAGNSSKTNGDSAQSGSPWLEWLAKLAGLLFIVGGVLAVATTLYVLLVNIATDREVSDFYWEVLNKIDVPYLLATLAVALFCGLLFSWFFEINIFGLNQFYRNRLVRCYLGATRWAPGVRNPQPFTGFDGKDDLRLSSLKGFRGPFPILNCALNLGGSSDLSLHTRHSASFSMTPLRCGADRRLIGYAPTRSADGEFAGGVMLGQAVAISGAAVSPNMGYNTSPLVAFLLTMFNVRLGWWFPNPGRLAWRSRGLLFSLYYMTKELFGLADETNLFVNVSDGGHFENLGIYELVRRRCKVIIASDAECDEQLQFGSLGNVVRICETDFGAKIDLDVSSIRNQKNGYSRAHCTVGKITYSNGSLGYLIYLKASLTGDEDVGVAQYHAGHPTFPHETTADQFFSEDQFESYRKLGCHVVEHALRGIQPGAPPVAIAEKLFDVWAPAGFSNESFVKHTKALDEIWERFRQSRDLYTFFGELTGNPVAGARSVPSTVELVAGMELIQLMENVFLDLRLDDFWEHPDNRGWAMLFMEFARSPLFREVWRRRKRTFGIRFEYFCEERLELPSDTRIERV